MGDTDESAVEIGTAEIPGMPATRSDFALLKEERFGSLKGGSYKVYARVRKGGVDRDVVTLVKHDGYGGYDVCADVPVKALAERPNTLALKPQVATLNPKTHELTVADAFVREGRIAVESLAADAIAPGLSLVARIGESALGLADKATVEGTYRGKNGAHAIIERDDHSLVACDYDLQFAKMRDGDPVKVSRDGDDLSVSAREGRGGALLEAVSKAELGASLSRDLFGGG